jgi:hypothetical protein
LTVVRLRLIPTVSLSVTANAAQSRKYIGDTLTSYVTVKDTKGTVLTGPMRVVVRDESIARDAGTGALVGAGDGSSYVVIVTGPLNTPKDSVRVEFFRELHGSVWAYDDSPLPALRAYSTNGTQTDSADVNASGRFSLKLSTHAAGWVTEVGIDAVDRGNRRFLPALVPVAVDCVHAGVNCAGSDITADVSFILVPRQYTVKRGLYAGRTLDVDLNAAMVTSMRTGPSYLSTSGVFQAPLSAQGNAPRLQNLFSASEFAWLADSLPIGVALHRGCCSTRAIVPDDSVQLWRALNMVQTTLGMPIWYPINDRADYNADALTTKTPNRVLLFQYDSSLKGAVTGGGATGTIAPLATSIMNQDFVVAGWRGGTADHLSMSDYLSQRSVIGYNPTASSGSMSVNVLVHEAMHTLGAGHGCQWASTQSYCGFSTDSLPSFEDAAYLLLAMDVKAAAWRHRALHSLSAALFGQRAFMLRLAPIPEPWTLPEPTSTGGPDKSSVPPRRRRL